MAQKWSDFTAGGTLGDTDQVVGLSSSANKRWSLLQVLTYIKGGLGSLAQQSASNVAITGGSIAGVTDLAVADGGTGASSASVARSNLGAAASGANSDITSLTGLTTPLAVAEGGTGSATVTAARTALGAASKSFKWTSSKWSQPWGGTVASGSAGLNTALHLFPLLIPEPLTLGALGAVVQAPSAGGLFMHGIYARDATTGNPTGLPLFAATGLSTAASGLVSSSAASVVIPAGIVWYGVEADNATATFSTCSATSGARPMLQAVGVSAANVSAASVHYAVTNTYGTFPDLTGITPTETATAAYALGFVMPA